MRAKDFVPASKPRNFVAKNQKTAGAGAHKDKKRAEKQGDVKHKAKQYDQGVAEAEIPSMYSKQVSPGMEHRARYKCPNCGIANKVQDWAANDNECPTCLEPLPYGLNQMPLKYQAEKEQGMAEGAVITKDQLVDIYIKGKGKNNMPIQKKVGAQIPNGKVNSFIAKVAEKYGLNPNAFVYGPSQTAEGWKSKVAGAALAGAAALGGGGAQASEPVTPLAVMATIKMKLPDGSIKTIKKDLGHSYDYRLDDARKDLENVLDRKGIKNYTIHLDRYNAGDANSTAPEKTKDYMDKTPSIGKADDNKNYMDKGPYTSKPSKTTYLDKSTGKEFRDMNNY